ncbi:heterocyst development glycosyltransferase HepC [Pseudanabaena sp. ABRG5-3]|uniref:heterocyst development glycosyltransferase HepC n=1 Tax=Pseudanabaena sp. ABRG5-3 TaxID=685565 RepID=UPI000DC71B5D|nr:heterocyst development glycosyltransferase HepC [Pseudanabaena sp. ABRG5-3]BBC25390.1 exopolysaccharide biosynthesis polyprenyl glycosylphosphotransferase [Pseudanabaena sp. ABRG5-3]
MIGLVTNKLQVVQFTNGLKESMFLSNFKFQVEESKSFVNFIVNKNFKGLKFPITKANLLQENVRKHDVNTVYVRPEIGEARLKHLADLCQHSTKSVFLKLPHADELPQQNNAIAWNIKRAIDWLAALVILIILSPVMIVLAAIIAGTSSGSIFFHQWRVGEQGRLFRIIKFRTMITDADKLHHLVMTGQTGLHKCEDDPRITPVGRWMRKYSLDELPQLFNVLRGEMSLVGPRPWALYDALRISGNGKRRLKSLPGVTGAWQVSARSTMLDLDAVTECDLSYLRSWSLWSDLKILLMTVPKVLSGFGAF